MLVLEHYKSRIQKTWTSKSALILILCGQYHLLLNYHQSLLTLCQTITCHPTGVLLLTTLQATTGAYSTATGSKEENPLFMLPCLYFDDMPCSRTHANYDRGVLVWQWISESHMSINNYFGGWKWKILK